MSTIPGTGAAGRGAGPGAGVGAALRRRMRHLPVGLASSAALLVVAVGTGAVLRGAAGAAGAAAGVGLVAASLTLSTVVVAYVDWRRPSAVMVTAVGTFLVKFVLLGFLMAAIAGTGWDGLAPMGIAIIAAVLVWSTAQAVWTWKAKIPYVEPLDSGPPGG